MEGKAYTFSKFLIFLPFFSIMFNKYPEIEVLEAKTLSTLHNVCK